MASFRIKTADTNTPDLQNLAASLSVAIAYATGIQWFIPNFQAANETIGNSTITNATISNLTATNLSATNTSSNSTITTFNSTTATLTAEQLLGGIIIFTGSAITQANIPSGPAIYSDLGIQTVGSTFQVSLTKYSSLQEQLTEKVSASFKGDLFGICKWISLW